MYCINCGNKLNDGDVFCTNCGAKVENDINTYVNSNVVQNNQTQTISNINTVENNVSQNQKPMSILQKLINLKNNKPNILAIIGGLLIGCIILVIIILSVNAISSNKLVCTSVSGNITIKYNKAGIKSYKSTGVNYDLAAQKDRAKEIGIDAYISEFNNWFISNNSGTCTINGKKVLEEKDNNTENTITVGDSNYGYINVPNNWVKFYDVDGNSSLQYSYASVYIVSLNYYEDSQYTAKEYASNYMYNKQNSSDVTGVTGATVKIGKNKEYTAYQVYMYYPADSTYLVTYWFEAEDGKVHYIALEGPEKITDYLDIPESFSLNKTV